MSASIWRWVMALALVTACSGRVEQLPGEEVAVSQHALTTLGTGRLQGGAGPFGLNAQALSLGQVISVPAGADFVLRDFTLRNSNLPSTVIMRAEVYAWSGSRPIGDRLFESAPASPADVLAPLPFTLPPGGLALLSGGQYVLFVTVSKDGGSGSGFLSSGNNVYQGGSAVSGARLTEAEWTQNAWTLLPTTDLEFSATFVSVGVTASSTRVVASVASPSPVGQTVAFTASVSSAAGTPAGQITFRDGATDLITMPLNAAGSATHRFAPSRATHAISAVYSGSAIHAPSSSATLNHQVVAASTSVTLASSANPSSLGTAITLSGRVAVVAPGAGVLAGTVTLSDGATALNSANVAADGAFSFAVSNLTIGGHNLSARFVPSSANFAASTSPNLNQTVTQLPTSVNASASPTPSTYGQGLTLRAAVAGSQPNLSATGTVSFLSGNTLLGTVALSTGSAELFVSDIAAGNYIFRAQYSGDANFAAASSSFPHAVRPAATTTRVTSTANPARFGQPVTLTASVAGNGAVPSGAVTFLDGATTLGVANMGAGTGRATLVTSALTPGAHNITARYGGSPNQSASTSPVLALTVVNADTVTTLSSSSSPALVATPITFSARVAVSAPGVGTPAGSIIFSNGATELGRSALAADGVATLVVNGLQTGSQAISAQYTGNLGLNASTGNLTQVITQLGASATLVSSANPSSFGAPVGLTVTVSANGGALVPTGSVRFEEAGTALGTGNLDAAGVSTFVVPVLSAGSHAITAVYGGDANFGSATAALVQTVTRADTSTVVRSASNPARFGQPVVLTAEVRSAVAGRITGDVVFSDASDTLATVALDADGRAVFTSAQLAVASHAISVVFTGDSNFAPSAAPLFQQQVDKANSDIDLVASPAQPGFGAPVTLTATVLARAPGAGVPTGLVSFSDTGTLLGSAALGDDGVARLTLTELAVGTHGLTAIYAGDEDFLASEAGNVNLEVAHEAVDITLVAMPNPATVGDDVLLVATLRGNAGVPTGALTFYDGDAPLGDATLDDTGVGRFTFSATHAGTSTLRCEYAGDARYTANAASTSLVIERTTSSTTLVVAQTDVIAGDSVTFTVSVSAAITGFAGSVELYDGGSLLGSVLLDGDSASFSTDALEPGEHLISASYLGDDDVSGSASDSVLLRVAPAGEQSTEPDADPNDGPSDSPTNGQGDDANDEPDVDQTVDPALGGGPANTNDDRKGGGCHVTSASDATSGAPTLALMLLGLFWARRQRKPRRAA